MMNKSKNIEALRAWIERQRYGVRGYDGGSPVDLGWQEVQERLRLGRELLEAINALAEEHNWIFFPEYKRQYYRDEIDLVEVLRARDALLALDEGRVESAPTTHVWGPYQPEMKGAQCERCGHWSDQVDPSGPCFALDEQGEGGGAPGEFRTPESALGSPSPVSSQYQANVDRLIASLCEEREEREKSRVAATQFCGAHIGNTFAECPACRGIERDDRVRDLEGQLAERDARIGHLERHSAKINSLIAAAAVALPVIRGAHYVTTEQQEVMDALGDATEYFLPPEPKTLAELLEEEHAAATPGTAAFENMGERWKAAHAAVEAAKEGK